MSEEYYGFLVIDKPVGITSFDVIRKLREITGIKKIGHTGTLDPMASGILLCAVGRLATKNISQFLKSDKEYIAEIELGKISDTYDKEGEIEIIKFSKKPKEKEIREVLKKFVGVIAQIPPIFSAKKIKGKKAYELARQGKKIKLKPIKVKINALDLLFYKWPSLKIKISCGTGTYVRSLANDIGQELGVGGYLVDLKRTRVEDIDISQAIRLEELNENNWKEFLIKTKEK